MIPNTYIWLLGLGRSGAYCPDWLHPKASTSFYKTYCCVNSNEIFEYNVNMTLQILIISFYLFSYWRCHLGSSTYFLLILVRQKTRDRFRPDYRIYLFPMRYYIGPKSAGIQFWSRRYPVLFLFWNDRCSLILSIISVVFLIIWII